MQSKLAKSVIGAIVALTLIPVAPVNAEEDVSASTIRTQLSTAISVLNPVSATLSGLVDYAVGRADSALKARLEQANAIVQSAIASLNDVLTKRIAQIDTYTRQQRVELSHQIEGLLNQVNADITRNLTQLDKITYQRINQVQMSAGNLLASLPIPTEPLVISDPTGFVVFKETGATTVLTVAGSGLFKDNDQPAVSVYRSDLKPETAFPVKVLARSMQYTQISLPNDRITDNTHYVVSIRFRKGNTLGVVPEYTSPSFPLFVCHKPPVFHATVQMTAVGSIWEKRVVQNPTLPAPFQLNCAPGQTQDPSYPIAVHAGWEIDTDYGNQGASAVIGPNDGRGDHRIGWNGSTFLMHCNGTNGAGGYQRVDQLLVGEKRAVPNSSCGPQAATNDVPVDYGKTNQIILDRASVVRNCIDPNLHAAPQVVSTLTIFLNNQTVETVHIPDHGSGDMLGNKLSYDLDEQGLLKLKIDLFCANN